MNVAYLLPVTSYTDKYKTHEYIQHGEIAWTQTTIPSGSDWQAPGPAEHIDERAQSQAHEES